ncbi:hypothetical protein FIBSPDRAFT_859340 [Athelia psychrophila]|uniref:Uncharacterized protein n=1 Tax=Athelia psychrophila TaxID=1759441 RepID=A0A166L400_9AGAM|nr:hypothetical protein FIBSPDRAFT_859340 [Fibularhizoctonia sp. CBS 109695]
MTPWRLRYRLQRQVFPSKTEKEAEQDQPPLTFYTTQGPARCLIDTATRLPRGGRECDRTNQISTT